MEMSPSINRAGNRTTVAITVMIGTDGLNIAASIGTIDILIVARLFIGRLDGWHRAMSDLSMPVSP